MSTDHGNLSNDFQPNYGSRAQFMRPATRGGADGSATRPVRCNLCNQTCRSNEALRAHYVASHPQELARLDALTAQLGLPTQRPGG